MLCAERVSVGALETCLLDPAGGRACLGHAGQSGQSLGRGRSHFSLEKPTHTPESKLCHDINCHLLISGRHVPVTLRSLSMVCAFVVIASRSHASLNPHCWMRGRSRVPRREVPWSTSSSSLWGREEEEVEEGSVRGEGGHWLVTGTSRGFLSLRDVRFQLPVNSWQHTMRWALGGMGTFETCGSLHSPTCAPHEEGVPPPHTHGEGPREGGTECGTCGSRTHPPPTQYPLMRMCLHKWRGGRGVGGLHQSGWDLRGKAEVWNVTPPPPAPPEGVPSTAWPSPLSRRQGWSCPLDRRQARWCMSLLGATRSGSGTLRPGDVAHREM